MKAYGPWKRRERKQCNVRPIQPEKLFHYDQDLIKKTSTLHILSNGSATLYKACGMFQPSSNLKPVLIVQLAL